MSRPWIAVGLLVVIGQGSRGDDPIAVQAQAVLKTYCYKCHGRDGRAEGRFNTVIDLGKLVADDYVKPKEPGESTLYKRMTTNMPPKKDKGDRSASPVSPPRPSADEIAAVKAWIEAGAPPLAEPAAKPRSFITDEEAVAMMLADVETVDVRSRHFIRYFTLTHLYNAGLNDDQLATYRVGLSKLVNSLSWGRRLKRPTAIDPAKTILRIDLADYKWNEATWSAILAQNPYGVTRVSKSAKSLYTQTACELPHVRADWFVFAASKPPLYHDVLGIPKTDLALEAKLDVDVAADIREERRIARAGFNKSGVSVNNRMIERHESSYGSYWKSYDFGGNNPEKGQLLFQRPLGPGTGPLAFRHDGGEIIFSLPNGLQGYMLTKADGSRLDEGPLNIVKDKEQGNAAVVNGISCMNCHWSGMLAKSDQIRPLAEKNIFAQADNERIKALYPPKATFDALLKEDEDRFAKAVEETGAAVSESEPIFLLARQFETELDLPLAAAEAGFRPDEFQKLIGSSNRLGQRLGLLLVPGGSVKRDAFVATFPLIVEDAGIGTYARGTGPKPPAAPYRPTGDRRKPTVADSANLRLPPEAHIIASVEPAEAKAGATVVYRITAKLEPGFFIQKSITYDGKPVGQVDDLKFDFYDTADLTIDGGWRSSKEATYINRYGEPVASKNFSTDYEGEVSWSISLRVPPDAGPGRRVLRCQVGCQLNTDMSCRPPVRATLPNVELNVLP